MGTNFYAFDPFDDRGDEEGLVHIGKRSFVVSDNGRGPHWDWAVEPGEMERWTFFVDSYRNEYDRSALTQEISVCIGQFFDAVGKEFS